MDENKMKKAMNDSRVKYNYLINNKINTFIAVPDDNISSIVIYCHGLGSNKTWAIRFYEKLLNNNIGIYAFDFPGHGDDQTDFSNFDLSLCISYLEEIIRYVKLKYNVPIYLFGCSFGGFVILNEIVNKKDNIDGTILMCPAINFCEIMENKSGISFEYFKNNDYMPLYNNIKIYKKAYLEFRLGDEIIKKSKFKNVSIIQGAMDKTVDCNNIKEFCNSNNLKLNIIDSGKHELYGFDSEIIDFILNIINEK